MHFEEGVTKASSDTKNVMQRLDRCDLLFSFIDCIMKLNSFYRSLEVQAFLKNEAVETFKNISGIHSTVVFRLVYSTIISYNNLCFRFHFRTYCNVFRGDHLVDWFVEVGLGSSRTDAVRYGNVLLQGRVIKHCTEEHYFYDLPYFYRFCESINSSTDSKSSDENNSKHYPETVVSSRSS